MDSLRFKKNNKGMTLVELLVAIAIFAAAIVPMMYAFVYSTAFNFKSQQTMQSTGIAQAIIEKCKGANVDQQMIKDMLADGSIFDGTQFVNGSASGGTVNADGSTSYSITGIQPVYSTDGGTSRRAYNVSVKFTEIKDARTDFSSVQSMSNDSTYNFCDFLTDVLANEDSVAESKAVTIIKNKWFTDANCEFSDGTDQTGLASYFSETDIDVSKIAIDRDIVININDSGVNVTVTYYFAGYDGSGPYDTIAFSKSGVLGKTAVCSTRFNASVSGEDIARGGTSSIYSVDFDTYEICDYPVTSVFFYYYPGYMNDSKMQDYFTISNNMTAAAEYQPDPGVAAVTLPARLDFYLYKQFKPFGAGWTETRYNTLEAAYDPQIELVNTPDAVESYFYHNLWWSVKNTAVNPGEHDYKLEKIVGFTPSITYDPDEWINSTTADSRYSSYSVSRRDTANNPSTGKPRMYSYVLRDFESLPGYYDDCILSGSETSRDSYCSRYRIEVVVYSAIDGKEVERMYSEVLNW